MTSIEIALELTKSAIENGLIKRVEGTSEADINDKTAQAIAKVFNEILNSVNDTLAGE